jgi:phage shock protein A
MAKAHEEKIAALGRVEAKYKDQVAALQTKIAELEVQAAKTTPTSGNSFAFPATNKHLTEKVEAYRTFISHYIIKAQEEKAKAVNAAEEKVTSKYEAIIEKLKQSTTTSTLE